MNFTRTKEDFECEQCHRLVKGDGYTNHCPHCLWSKHVDVEPGDRASECGGAMRPASVRMRHGEYVISHECVMCGFTRNQTARRDDNFEELLKVARGFTQT